jgi:hypothetical protein
LSKLADPLNELLDVIEPQRGSDQIVLAPDARGLINVIIEEHRRGELLRRYSLPLWTQEGSMRCYSLVCVALCFVFASGRACHAVGIEAAATAEQLIEACRNSDAFSPGCVSYSLNQKWKEELAFAGKPFSAIGRFDQIKRSVVGNLFAFALVGQYRVACKVTKRHAEKLANLDKQRRILISGVVDSYRVSFNLHRFHHLRLTPYCSIEIVT